MKSTTSTKYCQLFFKMIKRLCCVSIASIALHLEGSINSLLEWAWKRAELSLPQDGNGRWKLSLMKNCWIKKLRWLKSKNDWPNNTHGSGLMDKLRAVCQKKKNTKDLGHELVGKRSLVPFAAYLAPISLMDLMCTRPFLERTLTATWCIVGRLSNFPLEFSLISLSNRPRLTSCTLREWGREQVNKLIVDATILLPENDSGICELKLISFRVRAPLSGSEGVL